MAIMDRKLIKHHVSRWGLSWLVAVLVNSSTVYAAVSYQADILPILRSECLACHNEDDSKGELNLASYDGLMEGGASGGVIDPGDPDASLLYRLVAHLDQPSMPPETPMIAPESIQAIKQWIEGGAIEHSAEGAIEQIATASSVRLPQPKLQGNARDHFPPRLPKRALRHGKNDPAVIALASNPTTPIVAVGGVRQFWIHRTDTLECLGGLPFEGEVRALAFSLDGSLLVVGGGQPGQKGWVDLWDVAQAKKLITVGETLDAVRACAISSDHQRLAISTAGSKIFLYEIPSGKLIEKLEEHTDWITALQFSDDGVLLASSDRGGGLVLWDGWNGELFQRLTGHQQSIVSLEWTSDSNFISSAGLDGFIRIWAAEGGREVKKIKAHAGGVVRHQRTPGNGWISAGNDKLVRFWNSDGKSVRAFAPFLDMPTAVALCQTSQGVVAGDYSGHLSVVDGNSSSLRGSIQTNPPSIDQQIAQGRQAQKKLNERRKVIHSALEETKGQLERMKSKRALSQVEFDAASNAAQNLDHEILQIRRDLRIIQGDINETRKTGGDRGRLSQLHIRRKLAKVALQQSESALVEKLRVRDRLGTLHEELVGKIDRKDAVFSAEAEQMKVLKQESKRLLIELAALVEESAFSIAYDALQRRP